jgi:hypothetical protein
VPKKDPITGCMVMTTAEYFQSEADRNGRSFADEVTSFYEEQAKVEQEDEDNFFKPENLLETLKKAVADENQAIAEENLYNQAHPEYNQPQSALIPVPVKILEVVREKFNEGFKGTSIACRAKIETEDGQRGWTFYEYYNDHGSFYEPPSCEYSISFEKES